jgi:hypothetical protein
MQTQSVQTWRGCSETIPLAAVTPLEQKASVPVLSEDSPLRVGLPPTEQIYIWRPGAAGEVSIVRVEESSVPSPSLAEVHSREYSVEEVRSGIQMSPDLLPDRGSAQRLWNTASQAEEIRPEALRVSPEAPTEIKYRIWVQPMEESPLHQLGLAAERSCPPMVMPGLEALKAAIEHSQNAGEARLPGLDGFVPQRMVARGGTSLQAVVAVRTPEMEHLLYPSSRRFPVPANCTIG